MLYLYFSNKIIIKNIIFLFLDIDEKFDKNYDKKRNKSESLIRYKLMKYKDLINDFDMNHLQNYFNDIKNINNINKYNYIHEGNEKEILQNNFRNKLGNNIENKNNTNTKLNFINKAKRQRLSKKEIMKKSTHQLINTNSNYEFKKLQSNN